MRNKEEEEDGEERERQKGERLVEKLRRRVGLVGHNRVGRTSTPAHVTLVPWLPSVSSRKLAAALWEFHQYYYYRHHPLNPAKMHRDAHCAAGPSRRTRHAHGKAGLRDAGLDLSRFLPDPSPASPDHQPESAGSLRRHIAQTLMKHHQLAERTNQALQPVSPASCGSSLEVAPYNPVATPGSSLELRGRRGGEPHCNLKTSTELLKVLNRIWSLEEQHASNVSLIKALKTELAHARLRIKELLRDQQADRHELDDLMKRIAEDKLSRKTKEHDRISSAVQSVREELEDERKLRKRSESLHRKLARDLCEVKSTLSTCVKELEKETKSRKMLESLCDEFAKGIKNYEMEVHSLKQKLDKNWAGRDEQGQMVLHIAEAWLDERMQMKLESGNSRLGDNSVLEKLRFEIETFLQAKRKMGSNENPHLLPRNRRSSLESVPLNGAISAPRDAGDEEDSAGSDSNCFELRKPGNGNLELKKTRNGDSKSLGEEAVDSNSHVDGTLKLKQPNKDSTSAEKAKGQTQSPSSLQVKFEEQMAWAMSCNGKKKSRAVGAEKEVEESENCEVNEEKKSSSNKLDDDSNQGAVNANNVIGEMIRTHHRLLSEHQEDDSKEASCSYPSRRQASPVRQWMSRTITPDLDAPESSVKATQGTKENTLKAKLFEARSKSSRPRLRLFKGSS